MFYYRSSVLSRGEECINATENIDNNFNVIFDYSAVPLLDFTASLLICSFNSTL